MEIQLTISERLQAVKILNDFKGSLDKLSVILEDIKQFPIIEDEWVKAERKITTIEGGDSTWTWNDESGGLKTINVQNDTKEYLLKVIKEKDDKGEYTIKDSSAVTLKNKLVA